MSMTHSLPSLLCFAVLSLTGLSAEAELAYRLTPIIDPSSPNYVYPNALNNKGEVVGIAETVGTRAFHWKGGVYTDLGTSGGSGGEAFRQATSINDRSIIIGTQADEPRNFMIRKGELIPVQVATTAGFTVNAINNRNQIVGRVQLSSPFIWERGATTFLEDLPGSDGIVSGAAAINDHGVVVGTSGTVEARRAVIWKNGAVMALDLLPNSDGAEGRDINNFEQVVGVSIALPARAFFWENGTTTELPPLPTGTDVVAYSLNDWGVVAGTTFTPDNVFATLWIAGKPVDLNTLIDARDPLHGQVHLSQAFLINDRGQIVAFGTHRTDGTSAQYFLTPTYRPQPIP